MMGPYWDGTGWGWTWAVMGWLMMLVLWGLVIAGLAVLIRFVSGRGQFTQPNLPETPTAILRRRYAAGEITKEQFEHMKRDVA